MGLDALLDRIAGLPPLANYLVPRYVIAPLAAASFFWYGTLVRIGAGTGDNWEEVLALMKRYDGPLVWAGGLIPVALGVWWVRTRKAP